MWLQGSRHRRWPLEPSNRECQWKCSAAQLFYPTELKLQSQLEQKNHKAALCVKTNTNFACKGDFSRVLEVREWFLPSLTSAFSVSKTFCPLMSLWITWWEWRWERPWKTNVYTKTQHWVRWPHSWWHCQLYEAALRACLHGVGDHKSSSCSFLYRTTINIPERNLTTTNQRQSFRVCTFLWLHSHFFKSV